MVDAFVQQNGLMLGFLGVLVSMFTWSFSGNLAIPLKVLMPFFLLFVITVWILLVSCRIALSNDQLNLPSVLRSLPSNGITVFPILILEKSDLFGQGSYVSIFHLNEDGVELQMGSGFVSTIQMDGKIQVEVRHWASAHKQILEGVRSSNVNTLEKLLVKPTVTMFYGEDTGFERMDAQEEFED